MRLPKLLPKEQQAARDDRIRALYAVVRRDFPSVPKSRVYAEIAQEWDLCSERVAQIVRKESA